MFSKEISQNQKSKFDLYTKKQKLGIGQAAWNHEPIRTKEFVANRPHHVVTKYNYDVTYKVNRISVTDSQNVSY